MKIVTEKNLLYLLLFVFVSLNVFLLYRPGGDSPRATRQMFNNVGATFENTSYDFDTLKRGHIAIANFCLQNNSKTPVEITNVFSGCGCTAVKWDTTIIKPEERRIIKLQYNTQLLGPFYKWANVSLKGNKEPVKLIIRGVVMK
jgi:hypothetical protein